MIGQINSDHAASPGFELGFGVLFLLVGITFLYVADGSYRQLGRAITAMYRGDRQRNLIRQNGRRFRSVRSLPGWLFVLCGAVLFLHGLVRVVG
jgi:threonine/homoserine/homoserine lactone efflux protein